MGNVRPLPHKSMTQEMADYLLAADAEDIEQCSRHVLTPGHDETVGNHFESLAVKLAEHAILRYFFSTDAVPSMLDRFSESALATANCFRVRLGGGAHVQYDWRDRACSVNPPRTRYRATDPATLEFALYAALIGANNEALRFLVSLDQELFAVGEQPIQPSLRVMAIQSLCGNADHDRVELVDLLSEQSDPGRDLNTKFFHAVNRLVLALLETDFDTLSRRIEECLTVQKELFDNDRDNMRCSILGLVSMKVLAALIIGHRHGKTLQVTNRYIPDDVLAAALERQGDRRFSVRNP